MQQTIMPGKMFYIYPSTNPEVIEFFYILKGVIRYEHEGKEIVLKAQDAFSVNGLKEPIYFEAKTEVEYLWVITEPAFHIVSDDIHSLRDMIAEAEKRDPFTFKHSERVAQYAVKIAKKLNLSQNQLKDLYFASELHDIGKVRVPEEVLNKPGKLTNEEFDVIKKHPSDGAELVQNTGYRHLESIIIQHHERLNGSGYPCGLKEEEILLEAKIIAVSDTFDAMTEDRAYRKAFTAQYAMDELKRLAGIQYDEKIVNALEEILREEGKIE
ncbi:HD domain-containing phosphohydrolase [Peribacillus sp. SCS-155]|uniref:HD domain-containing phosphohydrolase n=1 Tax=Peribacillus sedimenti TaxID=3115297 RepID=UPI003905CA40